MSRTHKDKKYRLYKQGDYDVFNNWGVGLSECREYLKKWTNRRMRRCTGDIADGGAYKRMFTDVWDVS